MFDAVSRIIIPKLDKKGRREKTHRHVSNSKHLNTSAALPYRPWSTSGAKYNLSPSRSKLQSSLVLIPVDLGLGQNDAIPKSPILKRPSFVTNTFEGFKSRWITPDSWMNRRPYLCVNDISSYPEGDPNSMLTLLRSTMTFQTRASSSRGNTRPYSHKNRARFPDSQSSVRI